MEYLKYGLQNNELVHINEVASGLECNCICPFCKSQLIARKGQKKTYHFAHYRLSDCNHGTETALHIMVKKLVAQTKKIWVPFTPQNIYDDSENGKVVCFETAEIEKQLSDAIRSDVLLHRGDRALNVEIKVTHEVDLSKQIELFNFGVSTVEIDFSDMRFSFSPELILQRLMEGSHTKLLFSPKCKDICAKKMLGEWKKIYSNSYVEDCPMTFKRAYFVDYLGKGGPAECHECYGWEECDRSKGKILCRGLLGNFDFKQIEQIIEIRKEEGHLRYIKLLLKDGNVLERTFDRR
jgi:hypothetical protein